MTGTIESSKHKVSRFYLIVFLITLVGSVIRFININYASLWADELYSMLSVHPGNSWYEILYMQRTYQPPAYFMMLWGWTKAVGYNEFSARLLSVVGGILAIVLSALLGKKIKSEKLGLFMAILVAFNPTQILYSLEARFYIFAYCVAIISLWLHWHILIKKPRNFFLYFLLGGINALLCYFHHFGIFFVFALFVHDVIVYVKEKDRSYFFKKLGAYLLTALFYSPWFFWGLLKGLSTTQFWLKEIDVWKYFTFSMGYPMLINLGATILIIVFLLSLFRKQDKYFGLFPLIVFFVILIPLLYSVIRIPILVDRYGMVMAPAMYLMIGIGLQYCLKVIRNKKLLNIVTFLIFIILIVPGLNLTLLNKQPLMKQPWREMSQWLKHQPDYKKTNVYALGIYLRDKFTIDFYTLPEKAAHHINNLEIGKDKKMYLVETSHVWKIKDSVLNEVRKKYDVTVIPFQQNTINFGNIYVCTRKK